MPAVGELSFRTAGLEGTMLADGRRHGVTRLVHRPSGVELTGGPGPLLALYRILCRDGWLGEAREMRHAVEAGDDGLRLVWEPRALHLARLEAYFQVRSDDALDLEVTVTGCAAYEAYEVFLSNYFHPALRSGGYVRPSGEPPEAQCAGMVQIEPEAHPVFRNLYVTLPRDEAAAHLFTDGRWQRGRHWTRFLPARYYSRPMGYYRHQAANVDVLIMGLEADVPAVSMAYAPGDFGPDHVSDHHSLYFSLWGRDLRPGARWCTKLRLVVGAWGGDPNEHLRHWQAFAAEAAATGRCGAQPVTDVSGIFSG